MVIEARGLTRTYARGRIRAVTDVSFGVDRGEVFGLIGPDGAGKTSVLQILAGVLRAHGGAVTVAGIDVLRDPEEIKDRIGYMPQGLGLNLYDTLTVAENIEFFRDLRRIPRAQYRDNRDRLLGMTRLASFLDRPAGKLSGGMRQKLALICTLIHLPDVLLLDEPTTGVDPVSRRDFWTIVHTLVVSRGVTVMLTTSYMDEAERCHRVSLMHAGRFIASGTPDELGRSLGGETRRTLEEIFVHHLARDRPAPAPGSLDAATASGGIGAPTVRAERLTCRFGDFTAVDQVSLEVRAGEIVGLLGPNGAGKTTFIKMLCGLQVPTAGTAMVAGHDIRSERARVRASIGYMSQRFSLYRDQTVSENLRLSAGLYGMDGAVASRRMDALLAWLGLTDVADRLPLALPLGLRQRLALASAILHEPRVLFLDEPTAGVDPLARRQFWALVHGLAHQRGVGVLVSTHYMDETVHCDRLGFMHQGRLVGLGPADELTRQAERTGGPMVAVQSPEFARAFVLVHERIPEAMLYGRRIRWQSRQPEEDIRAVTAALGAAGIGARTEIQPLSMEDTFVSVLREAGLGRG
ncbi:MAG TPA: ATP-binding cassette domain-containing protein [Methylomirabilota bacterium]